MRDRSNGATAPGTEINTPRERTLTPEVMERLQRASQVTRDATSFFATWNTRIERYMNGWTLWDAYDTTAANSEPFTPTTIRMALERMPFVRAVVVDMDAEHPPRRARVHVRLRSWVPKRYREWCQEQAHDAVVQRAHVGLQLNVEIV
jgi:hypothetical protein